MYPPDAIQFPEQLSKTSVLKRVSRLRNEAKDSISHTSFLSDSESLSDYIDLLVLQMAATLRARDKEGVAEVISLMEAYQLSSDMLKGNCLELCSSRAKCEYQQLPQSLRTAVTKLYTKRHKSVPIDAPKASSESEAEEELNS